MRRLLVCGLVALAALVRLPASTLQQLSLDDMTRKSTSIVRGKPVLSGATLRGSIIYTHYQVQVSETLKGVPATNLDVAVLGGTSGGLRQNIAGAPTLVNGQDYVLFLWTSKTGLTQVIGLSQGLFAVIQDTSGQLSAVRAASTERMLNAAGQPVVDSDIRILLTDLRTRIQTVLANRGAH
jgi:hypothetical protein